MLSVIGILTGLFFISSCLTLAYSIKFRGINHIWTTLVVVTLVILIASAVNNLIGLFFYTNNINNCRTLIFLISWGMVMLSIGIKKTQKEKQRKENKGNDGK